MYIFGLLHFGLVNEIKITYLSVCILGFDNFKIDILRDQLRIKTIQKKFSNTLLYTCTDFVPPEKVNRCQVFHSAFCKVNISAFCCCNLLNFK